MSSMLINWKRKIISQSLAKKANPRIDGNMDKNSSTEVRYLKLFIYLKRKGLMGIIIYRISVMTYSTYKLGICLF